MNSWWQRFRESRKQKSEVILLYDEIINGLQSMQHHGIERIAIALNPITGLAAYDTEQGYQSVTQYYPIQYLGKKEREKIRNLESYKILNLANPNPRQISCSLNATATPPLTSLDGIVGGVQQFYRIFTPQTPSEGNAENQEKRDYKTTGKWFSRTELMQLLENAITSENWTAIRLHETIAHNIEKYTREKEYSSQMH